VTSRQSVEASGHWRDPATRPVEAAGDPADASGGHQASTEGSGRSGEGSGSPPDPSRDSVSRAEVRAATFILSDRFPRPDGGAPKVHVGRPEARAPGDVPELRKAHVELEVAPVPDVDPVRALRVRGQGQQHARLQARVETGSIFLATGSQNRSPRFVASLKAMGIRRSQYFLYSTVSGSANPSLTVPSFLS